MAPKTCGFPCQKSPACLSASLPAWYSATHFALGSQAHSFSVHGFGLSSFLSISPGKCLKSCRVIILKSQCLDKTYPAGGHPSVSAVLSNEFFIILVHPPVFFFFRLCFVVFAVFPRSLRVITLRAGSTSCQSSQRWRWEGGIVPHLLVYNIFFL